jgi:hypothetical protein
VDCRDVGARFSFTRSPILSPGSSFVILYPPSKKRGPRVKNPGSGDNYDVSYEITNDDPEFVVLTSFTRDFI